MSIDDLPAAPIDPLLECGVSPYLFSIDQYHQMIAAGILAEDERVQLLEGEIVRMTPIGPLHRYAVQACARTLAKLLPSSWELMIQQPITLANSEPEPDLCVVRCEAARYLDRHPGAEDVALVIEVADSTLPLDRNCKLPIYARAGIPEYWIVNLGQQCIEVYREPPATARPGQAVFSSRNVFSVKDAIPVQVGGQELGVVAVAELLPRTQ